MGDETSVKVAVRVRPFNQREKDRNAKLVIEMRGNMTLISNPDAPKEEPKKFTFDYSYWSHDGYSTDPDGTLGPAGNSSKYASQKTVFDDLGRGVLKNAFEGYNCSLFAYGQTGSGKSYSLIGYGPNKGIVPITCDELFKTIDSNKDASKRYEVSFSMLEIYNEQVRDLLTKESPKGGLPVRQNPQFGSFYVQGLKQVPVGSYVEIDKRMQQGTASRTIGSTNMNATSSRAHTLVTITFDQFIKSGPSENKKSSTMNLVDLAGSERADSTGATGDRLKEGANINKSLSALGNVISALADSSSGKKKIVVPYRDSILTKLLQNALGGNSKTIMIAALSPADINYDETVSTLRYADRAKRIKNKAIINEDPMDRLIRELREENERLKEQIKSGKVIEQIEVTKEMSPEEIEKLKKQMMLEAMDKLKVNQEKIEASVQKERAWSKKLELARAESFININDDRKLKEPHLMNINEDLLLSGVVFHFLNKGVSRIGRKDAKPAPDICFSGLSIMRHHADIVKLSDGTFELRPMEGAKVKVNGQPIREAHVLNYNDRVLFGSNHLYVFINPLDKPKSRDADVTVTWEMAQMEIAQAQGFTTTSDMSALSRDKQITQEQVLELLPFVSEVNALSEEMNKYKTFDVVLLALDAYEGINARPTKVMVQMKDLLTQNVWLWERGKFLNRRFIMQDLYQTMLDGDLDIETIPNDEDPFWEPVEDMLLGHANIFLQSLAYLLDFEDSIPIRNFKGDDEGALKVHILPCSSNGRNLGDEHYVEQPKELVGKPYHFKILVKSLELHDSRHKHGLYVRYNVRGESIVQTKTDPGKSTSGCTLATFNHSHIISFPSVTKQHVEFFENGCVTFCVYAVQVDCKPNPKLAKMSTKELRKLESTDELSEKKVSERRKSMMMMMTSSVTSPDASQLKSEVLLLQRKCERLESKERRLQELCREWSKKSEEDKIFEVFFGQINTLAFSSGRKLKTRVKMITQPLQAVTEENDDGDDEMSVFVFGDDEKRLANEANKNGGYLSLGAISQHFGSNGIENLMESKRNQNRRQSIITGKPLANNNNNNKNNNNNNNNNNMVNAKNKKNNNNKNNNHNNKNNNNNNNFKSDVTAQTSSACVVQ